MQLQTLRCAKRAAIALLVVFYTCLGTPERGHAEEWIAAPSGYSEAYGANSVSGYLFKTFPHHLFEGFKESFGRFDNLAWLALAGGTAGGLQGTDKDIQTYFREERPFQTGMEIGNNLGNIGVLFGLSTLTFGVGEFIEIPSLSETGVMMFEALAITSPVTMLFKGGVQRRRPDDSNNLSFPSMHASGSFALANVTRKQYGFLAGIPAYLAATWVAMSRVQKDKHFFSDTLFGAALGMVISNAVVNVHRREKTGSGVTLLPVVSTDTLGLLVSVKY